MSSKITAKQLRAAAAIVESRMLAELDANEIPQHEFSDVFKQKMEPVLKKARRQEQARQTVRTIAVSLVIVILCGIIWVATHAEAREAIQKWFTFTWNNIISYRFTEEYTGEFPTYRPTWLPDGYKETDLFETPVSCDIEYEDEEGGLVFFSYMVMDDGQDISFLVLNEDEVRIESVMVCGMPGDFYNCFTGNEQSSLIWMDEKNKITYTVSGKLEPDIIMRIAESVSKEKP